MGHLRSMLKDREEDPINQHNESQISPEPVRKKHRFDLLCCESSCADASVSKWQNELLAYIDAPLIPYDSDVLQW
jgi:hypothetical protein